MGEGALAAELNRASFLKIQADPRVTRVGHFLRNASLDELPQLANVVRGDMSLVGNRTLSLYEAETLTTDADAERFLAPAEITGLWQVTERGVSRVAKSDLRILLLTLGATQQRVNV